MDDGSFVNLSIELLLKINFFLKMVENKSAQ